MSKTLKHKQPLLPVIILLIFSLILLISLVYRVNVADRDLGILRLEQKQARLAAESGVNFALTKIHQHINFSANSKSNKELIVEELWKELELNKWQQISPKNPAKFRITSIRKTSHTDDPNTVLIDEGLRYQILSEGKCKGHLYTTNALIQLYDLTKIFGVFSSLDEFYYGIPIQPWIELGQSLESFIERNEELFASNKINSFGICQTPELLYRVYEKGQESPFKNPRDDMEIIGNYGKYYEKSGISPSFGPMYSALPIIVDNHKFKAPIQTAYFFLKRSNTSPRMQEGNSLLNLHSSPSIQKVAKEFTGNNQSKYIIDKDADEHNPVIPPWRPDFNFYKKLSKSSVGIYINKDGKGFRNGEPIDVDYHPGTGDFYSDSYKTPNQAEPEQDQLNNKDFIVLSTANKFNEYNNLSKDNLKEAKIIYSERSVFIRGEVEGDLTIVTPGHIFITGPTNIDSNLNLMLIGRQGTAISTIDLERIIQSDNSTDEFINAAREWIIKAIIYKPGAGIYTTKTLANNSQKINFKGLFRGESLRLKIFGACIGGNLTRWLDNTETSGLEIHHLTNAADRLINRPYGVNILKLQTKPEKN